MRPGWSTGVVTLGLLVAACGAREREHEAYVAARVALGGVAARTGDDLCREEPTCSEALAALGALGEDSADREEAQKLLARVAAARKRGPLVAQGRASGAAAAPTERRSPEEVVSPASLFAPATGEVPVPKQEDGSERPKKGQRPRSADYDDDWGLSVVGGAEPGSERSEAPAYADEPPPLQYSPEPPRVSCGELRAAIEKREIEVRREVNAGWRHRQPREMELEDLERGDGTARANFDDDPIVRRLKELLPGCKEP